ncbi:adenylate cyclase type 10-like [Ptychodera flava]|uniref:adenylate cyclase type 10-like n=1 Tax=Ptychodera flava TaxID=63121 RepID=UPI00396AA9D4
MRPFPPSRPSCPSAARVLQSPTTLHIKLPGLVAEFLASLACQILEVASIPEDLLKILKKHSHGVASWCEQLLRDMFFSKKILIVSENDLKEVKLVSNHVVPESHTLTRTRRASISSKESTTLRMPDSRRASLIAEDQAPLSVVPNGENGQSDKERAEEEDYFEEHIDEKKFCVVTPGVKLNEIPVPDSMKGMMLAKIDRLKSGDQMVVKCAAVLGLSFTRSLLEKIVPNFNSRKIRMSIHSLMQLRLFECAAKHPGHHAGLHHSSLSHHGHQRLSAQVECHCPRDGDYLSTDARTNISNCRLLRFKTSLMQEVAYTLFLSDQRRKLHEQAALFLESQAHKCKSCGGGEFIHHYQSVSHSLTGDGNELQKGFGGEGDRSGGRGSRRGKSMAARKRPAERSFRKERRKTIDDFEDIEEEEEEKPKRRSTIIDSFKKVLKRKSKVADEEMEFRAKAESRRRGSVVSRLSEKLKAEVGADVLDEEVTFYDIDLRDCECPQVLASVYPQLVRHWRAASNTGRTIHFLTEAGGAAISTHNNMAGVSYLMEAHGMLKDLEAGRKPLIDDPEDDIDIDIEEKARVESLIGQALLHMGRLEEAMPHLLDALKSLGNKQPTTYFGFCYRLIIESMTQYLHLKYPHKYVGHAASRDCNLFVEQSRCLSHVWHVYHEIHEDMKAWLAALQQINRAEKADDDLHDLLVAYMAMIESCQIRSLHDKVQIYEEMALARCVEVTGFSADDLITVGHLYSVVMGVRLSGGRIQKSIDSGFQALKVSERLHDNSLKLSVLPTLAAALMLGNKSVPCVEVLEQLDYISDEEEDVEGRGWYFCCCLDLLLELGFALESHNKCVDFVTKAAADPWHVMNPIPRYYMSASLALWYSRKNDWDQAEQWFLSALNITPETFETYMTVNAYVKMVESQLIAYSHARRVIADISKMRQQAWQALQYLHRLCKKFQVCRPRYCHLLAFYYILSGDKTKCGKWLNKSLILSEQMSNNLEHQWAEHSQIVWFDPNHSEIQDEFWQLSTEDDLDWHIASAIDGEISKYSLPLPHRLH